MWVRVTTFEEESPLVVYEDDGAAAIIELGAPADGYPDGFVRVQSWDPSGRHPLIRALSGQRMRVTIEKYED